MKPRNEIIKALLVCAGVIALSFGISELASLWPRIAFIREAVTPFVVVGMALAVVPPMQTLFGIWVD